MLEGEFVLVTDSGRETIGPGTCVGFPAGTGDGHHFLNLTQNDAVFLVIGDRTAGDEVTYPDIDVELKSATRWPERLLPKRWYALSARSPELRPSWAG